MTERQDQPGVDVSGRAAGVFDLRIWAEADSTTEVWARVVEALQRFASLFAPEGVTVKYVQLRDPTKTKDFDATMGRPKRRKAA